MPIFLVLEAQALAKAGRPDEALKTVDEALAICEAGGESWAMGEVLRTKASVLQSKNTRTSEINLSFSMASKLLDARERFAGNCERVVNFRFFWDGRAKARRLSISSCPYTINLQNSS